MFSLEDFINKKSEKFKDFYFWSLKFAEKHNKIIEIRDRKYINNSGRCIGICDGEKMILAAKSRLFEETYVHEFCHLLQAIDGGNIWIDDLKIYSQTRRNKLGYFSWESIFNIMTLEHDCEKRAIKLAKRWDLFNLEKYAQRANLYLYFHQYGFLSGSFSVIGGTIYRNELVKIMPTKLLPLESFAKIDMNIMTEFNKKFKKL